VHLKVNAEAPPWTVDPEAFEFSMSVYGKLKVDNVFSSDPDDLLAVFSGGNCVGVTRNTYNEENDLWYAFLTMYSHTTVQDDLEFRIWDASTGKIFQAVPSATITFSNGAIAGTAREPIIYNGREMLFQEIALNQGWNWISFHLTGPQMNDINAT